MVVFLGTLIFIDSQATKNIDQRASREDWGGVCVGGGGVCGGGVGVGVDAECSSKKTVETAQAKEKTLLGPLLLEVFLDLGVFGQ